MLCALCVLAGGVLLASPSALAEGGSWSYAIPGGPTVRGVAAFDVNEDGAPDAIVLGQEIMALDGRNGDVLWTSDVGADTSFAMAMGDLEGDGRQDVVVAAFVIGSSLEVLPIIGSPVGVSLIYRLDPHTGRMTGCAVLAEERARTIVSSLALADVTGDGVLDAATNRYEFGPADPTADVRVLDGSALQLGPACVPAVGPLMVWTRDVAGWQSFMYDAVQAADLTGDGLADLIVATNGDAPMLYVFNGPSGDLVWSKPLDSSWDVAAAFTVDAPHRRVVIAHGSATGRRVEAVDGATGTVIWSTPWHRDPTAVRINNGQGVAVVAGFGGIASFSLVDGGLLWDTPTFFSLGYGRGLDLAFGSFSAAGAEEVVGSFTKHYSPGYCVCWPSGVGIFDLATGAFRGEATTETVAYRLAVTPADAGPRPEVFTGTFGGTVHAFDMD